MNKATLLGILALIVLSVPTFWRMAWPGIYSMQDPVHYFRLVEYDKCVKAGQIPCRWAPDAGLGYGEPVFNFYSQLSYAAGEVLHLIGLPFIDSLKVLFIFSLVGSGLGMFLLARYLWQDNLSALVSGILYVYAPYRAVDVWVRGALPEALGFVYFPLVILSVEKKSFIGFTLSLTLLLLTHNLSVLIFAPVILVWITYRRFWKAFPAAVLSGVLSGFYLLPLIFESKYITLSTTIQGYFDFRGHFATLNEMLISRFWGYGASLFQETLMSRSVGQVQWIVPLGILVAVILKKKAAKYRSFLVLAALGWLALFMAHNKSTFVWLAIPQLAYVQFPWRFLAVATFCFSLASGAGVVLAGKYRIAVASLIILAAIGLNYSFFREDIWHNVTDADMAKGLFWETQISASIGDFWPNFGHIIPNKPSDGKYINYFPGWEGAAPDKNGLIPASGAVFRDTPIRTAGNTLSVIGMGIFILLAIWRKRFHF